MARTYETPGWQQYVMQWDEPHRTLEPLEQEIAVVDGALQALVEAGILPHQRYDEARFLAHRAAVREQFDIPWTAITPRLQRLMYAISAIHQPQVLVAVGVFCGNTFFSNAGAGAGPGAVYTPKRLVGIEIRPDEAARAARNVARVDREGRAEVIAADGIPWLQDCRDTIDLLYLDADGNKGQGKEIYLELLEAAGHCLRPGSLILAHNSVNCAADLPRYLATVRDPARFRESVNVVIDDQGLEVTQQ